MNICLYVWMHSDFCRLPATRNTNITMYNIVILLYAEPIWLKWNKFAADVHNCQLNRNDTTARGVSQYIPIHVPYISILYIHNSWYMKILGMRCNALTEHFYIWQDSRHLIYVARDWWSENICVQNWSIYLQYILVYPDPLVMLNDAIKRAREAIIWKHKTCW